MKQQRAQRQVQIPVQQQVQVQIQIQVEMTGSVSKQEKATLPTRGQSSLFQWEDQL